MANLWLIGYEGSGGVVLTILIIDCISLITGRSFMSNCNMLIPQRREDSTRILMAIMQLEILTLYKAHD